MQFCDFSMNYQNLIKQSFIYLLSINYSVYWNVKSTYYKSKRNTELQKTVLPKQHTARKNQEYEHREFQSTLPNAATNIRTTRYRTRDTAWGQQGHTGDLHGLINHCNRVLIPLTTTTTHRWKERCTSDPPKGCFRVLSVFEWKQ